MNDDFLAAAAAAAARQRETDERLREAERVGRERQAELSRKAADAMAQTAELIRGAGIDTQPYYRSCTEVEVSLARNGFNSFPTLTFRWVTGPSDGGDAWALTGLRSDATRWMLTTDGETMLSVHQVRRFNERPRLPRKAGKMNHAEFTAWLNQQGRLALCSCGSQEGWNETVDDGDYHISARPLHPELAQWVAWRGLV